MSNILRKHQDTKGIIVFPPLADWNIPLFQRPHQMAIHLAKKNYLIFYCTGENRYDTVEGFQQIAENCYLTDQFRLIINNLKGFILDFYSTQQTVRPELVYNLKKDNIIIYEYMDHIHEHISGNKTDFIFTRHQIIHPDIIITSASNLYEEMLNKFGKERVIYLPNAVDYEHFHISKDLKNIPIDIKEIVQKGNPIIGYYGALAKWIDYELINKLATSRPQYEIILIGWDFDGSINRLDKRDNIHYLGTKSYNILPLYGIWFDVAIIPFIEGELADSTSPIKLFEYMALGKPIVTTNMKECKRYKSVLAAQNYEEFLSMIDRALKLKDNEEYLKVLDGEARENTWEKRAEEYDEIVQSIISKKNDNLIRHDTKESTYFYKYINEIRNEINSLTTQLGQLTAEIDNLNAQLGQIKAERENLYSQLGKITAERDNLNTSLNMILNSDFWKVASFYYRIRDKIILLRAIHGTLKWMKEKIRESSCLEYLSKFRRYAKNYGIKRAIKKSLIKITEKARAPLLNINLFYALHKYTKSKKLLSITEIPPGALEGNKYDIFFFPMIDFSFRYQRPQQLASYFAKEGHRVFYMNITQFLPDDSKEEFRIKEIKEHLYEVFLRNPNALDVYGGELNENVTDILYSSINALRKKWGLLTAVGVVHNPFWTPLVLKIKHEHNWKIIYDCLDEWDTFAHIGAYFLTQESELIKKADLVTVTADLLYKKWYEDNNSCTIVRNACDYEHFLKASPNNLLANIKHPIVGFFGGIADWVDIKMINYAAIQRKEWSFVLLGGIFTDVTSIEKLPNVYLPGNKPYELMPDYLYNFDVCIIPFKRNKITEAVDPVKLYEYFSLGKPVVSRDLHEIGKYRDYVYLFDTKEDFIKSVEKALDEKDIEIKEKRRKLASTNTWEERIKSIDSKIREKYGRVSIIIVTYNNLEYNRLCLENIISKTDYPNYEIIVVDNNSSDGTPDYLKNMEQRYSFIKIILNNENIGFAKANNQGIKNSTGDYIVFLNNDTVVTKGWLTKFVNYLDKYPEIGLIGPVTNSCGNEAQIDTDYNNLDNMNSFAYQYTIDHEGIFFDIRMLAFYCTAMRKEILDKVGLLDEEYGIGMFEDDDYSHRVKLQGYRIVCAEDIFIHHYGQGAFKKLIDTGKYYELFNRNRNLFEKKWGVKWVMHKHRSHCDISSTQTINEIKKTKEHWGKEAGTWRVGRGIYWLEHEEVLKRINEKVSGDPNKTPIHYLKEFMIEKGFKFPIERCLTLGCGAGDLERGISQLNFCLRHDAFDISEKAIEKAILAAKEQNLTHINYEVKDINEIHLPESIYDVIFGVGSVHHFARLEHIFKEVNKALKTDGIFFVNEYIGPSRFQWTERQLEVINAILKVLPKKYKTVVTDPTMIKEIEVRPTPAMVADVDPSEAVRSEEILSLLKKYFDILEIKNLGGAILHTMLTNIAGNFKLDNEDDMKLLYNIFDFEDILMKNGDLSSDFSVIIAKKKS